MQYNSTCTWSQIQIIKSVLVLLLGLIFQCTWTQAQATLLEPKPGLETSGACFSLRGDRRVVTDGNGSGGARVGVCSALAMTE